MINALLKQFLAPRWSVFEMLKAYNTSWHDFKSYISMLPVGTSIAKNLEQIYVEVLCLAWRETLITT